MSATSLSP